MEFSVKKELLLKPLQSISGIVEKKQILPVLSNVLLSVDENTLSIIGTDLEVELTSRIPAENVSCVGATTVSARKLTDICKNLPNDSLLNFQLQKKQLVISSGQSKFNLATLSQENFPKFDNEAPIVEIEIKQNILRNLLEKTSFAMAQQDVRYYLNGIFLEIEANTIRAVATDGHRLATSETLLTNSTKSSIILPRKAILELLRLLTNTDKTITFKIGKNHIQTSTPELTFVSKLIDGRYPDYNLVIPKNGNKVVVIEKILLEQALARTAILTHEKFHGVRVELHENSIKLSATNAENEQSEENIAVNYQGEYLEIGLNINYLRDVINVIHSSHLKLTFLTKDSSVLIEDQNKDDKSTYVIMPMRL